MPAYPGNPGEAEINLDFPLLPGILAVADGSPHPVVSVEKAPNWAGLPSPVRQCDMWQPKMESGSPGSNLIPDLS